MPNGDIAAVIFNQPCHGHWEGDAECWVSEDEGCTWRRRGVAAPHEPGTNRMNVAAGLAGNGDFVALVSGWTNKFAPGERVTAGVKDDCQVLSPWVCRSRDGGRTWTHSAGVTAPDGFVGPIPFGDITQCADGTLVSGCYGWPAGAPGVRRSLVIRSRDDGETWGEASVIQEDGYGEPAVFQLGQGSLLVGLRSKRERRLELASSADGGHAWSTPVPVTGTNEHPAHLLRLSDGRILLSYGIRHRGLHGVGARVSDSNGERWGFPMILVNLDDAWDAGYPSSVELADGAIVTAYYANQVAAHRRYHMGVLRWRIEERTALNTWPG